VQYFGNYDPTITEDICEVIALPIRIQLPDEKEEKGSLPVAFCAWHFFNYFRGPKPDELAVVRQYADLMPVFGFAEMGAEYNATATTEQVTIAHQLVDTGLDFLMANNPHWVQNTEAYNGKLIVYSLGNFIFDQIDAETQRGASIDTTLDVTYDANVAKWLVLGPSCAKFKDACLATAQQQALKKVNFTLTHAVVASQGGAGQVTRKADLATQQAVEGRMNWAETIEALGQ
jgi:poly-gamma-glutamate synthesis protein (capsule biosynthesis protein)